MRNWIPGKILLLTIVILKASALMGQEQIRDFVLKNTWPVKTLEINDTANSDLQPLANAIGDASFVLLGTQEFADAPSMQAKIRLVKYLHEHLDFNVLAFESDFYSLHQVEEAYKSGSLSIDELFNNLFPQSSKCTTNQDLFDYIVSTQSDSLPLMITGFNDQPQGNYARDHYKNDFYKYAHAASVPDHLLTELEPLLDMVQQEYPIQAGKNQEIFTSFAEQLNNLKLYCDQLPDSSFFKILAANLQSYVNQSNLSKLNAQEIQAAHDLQMAANIRWISEQLYRGKKIIIWSNNYHVAKNAWGSMGPNAGKHLSMGHFLFQDLPLKMYVLGFTSGQGRSATASGSVIKLPKPAHNSLEEWIAVKNAPYAFVNFSAYREGQRELFYMKGNEHKNEQASWNEVFDGVFYIQNMYPCKIPRQKKKSVNGH